MHKHLIFLGFLACLVMGHSASLAANAAKPNYSNQILTPPAPAAPRINGPDLYGQRPGRPFFYTIPATGDRPMTFSADSLPAGLTLNSSNGQITGSVKEAGEYHVTLHAKNAKGETQKAFTIVIGDKIALTPPMGWNSWNCWAGAVDQDKVLQSAQDMVKSGLVNHGWTYINIDDTWQGDRGGPFNGLQGDKKFPDMKKLCDQIHALGLKIGIYSTPWITSYADHAGGSSDNPQGKWNRETMGTHSHPKDFNPHSVGKYHFASNDAKQWAAWGFDYLKYDWYPNDVPDVQEMANALNATGRDFVYSLSNHAPFEGASDWARLANLWRTTGDIRDSWASMTKNGFSQNKWAPFAGPGHWNDPDMLVVGWVGWGPKLHYTHLNADEQCTHISLWCLLSAPLILGNDLHRLDPFTLSLLTNDEVLAVDQDPLGKQATLVAASGPKEVNGFPQQQVWAKPLADGSMAVGLFNLGDQPTQVTADFSVLKIIGKQTVRDLWRQKDLGDFSDKFEKIVNPHGVVLVKISRMK